MLEPPGDQNPQGSCPNQPLHHHTTWNWWRNGVSVKLSSPFLNSLTAWKLPFRSLDTGTYLCRILTVNNSVYSVRLFSGHTSSMVEHCYCLWHIQAVCLATVKILLQKWWALSSVVNALSSVVNVFITLRATKCVIVQVKRSLHVYFVQRSLWEVTIYPNT